MTPANVIVLGAGASAAEGAPLQSQLFKEYFALPRTPEDQVIMHEMDRDLATFFHLFFGIDVDESTRSKAFFPTFEEVLAVIELAIAREQEFKGFTTRPEDASLQRLRQYLILLIWFLLDRKLGDRSTHHRKLLKSLKATDDLENTCFISLNYDILIDNALTERYRWQDLDYGVDFANFGIDWNPPRENAFLLLKLHGSLNWLYCPTCTGLTLTPNEKSVGRLLFAPQDCTCVQCGSPTTAILIPPTYFKVMGNIHLQRVWHRADMILRNCTRLIFCGYSFPDADIYFKYLLKRMEVNSGATPEVFIVNEHSGKDASLRREEKVRYLRFFRDSGRIHYTDLSFEEFAEQGMPALRRPPQPGAASGC